MKLLKNLLVGAGLAACSMAMAQSSLTPDIVYPDLINGVAIRGLSDNGLWAVSVDVPDEADYSDYIGAHLFEITGSTVKETNLAFGETFCSAFDVTNDGKMVVGSYQLMPAVCRNVNGKWTWEKLPIPTEKFEVENFFTDKIETYTLNGGQVDAVTPDGKYAVGRAWSSEYIMLERACMWDLATGKLIELKNRPITDFEGVQKNQDRYMQISADGRYVLGMISFSYSGSLTYIYDRNNDEVIYINHTKGADGKFTPRLSQYGKAGVVDGMSKAMTSDGHYVAGKMEDSYGNDVPFVFDVWNKTLTAYPGDENNDALPFSLMKDGTLLLARPGETPYADGYVYYDNFQFSFAELLQDVYGINLLQNNIENTGKPTMVSDDGRTIVMLTEPGQSYLLRLKEDLKGALDRIDLFASFTSNPANNSKMSTVKDITLSFQHDIEVDASKASGIRLYDSKGNAVASALSSGGLLADGNRMEIHFRNYPLNAGETYTLRIPAEVAKIKGRAKSVNKEISLTFSGRESGPVKVTAISPANGVALASLDLNDNPVVVTYDAPIKVNGDINNRPIAHLYVDGDSSPVASINIDVDLASGNKMILFPTNTVYLYKGSNWTLKVPAGAVTDISGNGSSEAFSITYEGAYTPQLGDERYLFKSEGDSFVNFLLYEGDLGQPTEEYENFGFTQDTTPWWHIRDNAASTDNSFASHSCYVDGRQADDWMVTRQIKIPEDTPVNLTFDGQSYKKDKKDVLKVYVYEKNENLNSLPTDVIEDIQKNGDLVFNEALSPGATEENIDGEWTKYTIDLNKYQGKNIYICFVNQNKNQSMIMVDNIYVVRDVKAFVTMRSNSSVVNQKEQTVKGILSIASDLVNYKSLSMTLKDGKNNTIATINKSGLNLKAGDTYDFEFDKPLPLTVGVENQFTIEYKLDNDEFVYEGTVRDLAFEPRKRVVIEEYTGQACQFCPLGIIAMEYLEKMYGDRIVPVILHCYNGSDPKGMNMIDYATAVFNGNTTAPNARINRRNSQSAPLGTDNSGKYHYNAAETSTPSTPLWLDEVAEEFNEPAFMEVSVIPNEIYSVSEVSYTAKIKSALNLTNQNIRVLGVLLEDNISDLQKSGIYSLTDPLLGEFANGGQYAKNSFRYNFCNVARGYWGQSHNGTAGLLPRTLEAGQSYDVDIYMSVPAIVKDIKQCKMAVILIDENTGKVINAAVEYTINEVEEIVADQSTLDITLTGSTLNVASASQCQVMVFTIDGRMIASAHGDGNVELDLSANRGVVIVKAVNADGKSESKKLIVR